MKHALKIAVPLILIIALLMAAGLFFFFFRTDLTASLLMDRAQKYAQEQRYDRAIQFYTAAARLQPDSDKTDLGLYEAYLAEGNYTKAEYTLVSAIQKHPENPEFYIQLSRVYAMQDKLLDAQQMLDRITNPAVREAISALRPAAPVIEPAGGFYSEYIEVSVSSEEGTVCCVLNTQDSEEYPSAEDVCEGPITLPGGVSKITAVVLGDNYLVSPAVTEGYTIGSVVEEIQLSVPAVETLLREMLEKAPGEPIMSDELWSITSLDLPAGITDLTDLALLTGLEHLSVHEISAPDLSPLAGLENLKELDLSGCTLSSGALERIGTLDSLETLVMQRCAVSAVNALVGLSGLKKLDLAYNSVSDLTALSALTELQELNLTNNPLSGITHLNSCIRLQALSISGCGVSRIGALAENTSLVRLEAADNFISDLSVLSGCSSLQYLDVRNNAVSDISVLALLPSLEFFYADNNQITQIPDFDETVSPLVRFEIPDNGVSDVGGLWGLQKLNFFNADYNHITDLSPLGDCPWLIQIDVWDNPLDQELIPALRETGVIVNYNPNYEPPAELLPPAAE